MMLREMLCAHALLTAFMACIAKLMHVKTVYLVIEYGLSQHTVGSSMHTLSHMC